MLWIYVINDQIKSHWIKHMFWTVFISFYHLFMAFNKKQRLNMNLGMWGNWKMSTGGTVTEFISNIVDGVLLAIWSGVAIATLNSVCWAGIKCTWLIQCTWFLSRNSIASLRSAICKTNIFIITFHYDFYSNVFVH